MKLGLRDQVKDFKVCFWREKMGALGWVEVPTVHGSGVKTWAGMRRKITQLYGEGSVLANGWKNPSAVLNEELLTFNGGILEKLESSQSASEGCNVLVGMPTLNGPERLHELSPYSGLSMSSGWTFSIGDYSESEIPKGFHLKIQDAIFQWNEWWTRSHIETGWCERFQDTARWQNLPHLKERQSFSTSGKDHVYTRVLHEDD